MTLLGLVIVRGRRDQAKKISWKGNPCREKWVTMTLNMSDKEITSLAAEREKKNN